MPFWLGWVKPILLLGCTITKDNDLGWWVQFPHEPPANGVQEWPPRATLPTMPRVVKCSKATHHLGVKATKGFRHEKEETIFQEV